MWKTSSRNKNRFSVLEGEQELDIAAFNKALMMQVTKFWDTRKTKRIERKNGSRVTRGRRSMKGKKQRRN